MRYVEAGAEWILLVLRPPFDRETLAIFAQDVAPQLREATE